jgi:hypothetical protein
VKWFTLTAASREAAFVNEAFSGVKIGSEWEGHWAFGEMQHSDCRLSLNPLRMDSMVVNFFANLFWAKEGSKMWLVGKAQISKSEWINIQSSSQPADDHCFTSDSRWIRFLTQNRSFHWDGNNKYRGCLISLDHCHEGDGESEWSLMVNFVA